MGRACNRPKGAKGQPCNRATNTTESAKLLGLHPAFRPLQVLLPQRPVHVAPPATPLFREQQACQRFLLVLAGQVRGSRATGWSFAGYYQVKCAWCPRPACSPSNR